MDIFEGLAAAEVLPGATDADGNITTDATKIARGTLLLRYADGKDPLCVAITRAVGPSRSIVVA